MTLSDRDAKLFYELWLPLLDYVNETCKVNRKVKNLETGENLNPQEVKEIANVLWDDVSLIDRYLMGAGKGISDANKEIIRSWKRRIQGRFVMERHLKKGTIFVAEDSLLYDNHGARERILDMLIHAQMAYHTKNVIWEHMHKRARVCSWFVESRSRRMY